MNTGKKETEICGIRVNPCPKDRLRPEAALSDDMEIQLEGR